MQLAWLLGCVDFFFQAEDGIRDYKVTAVQPCALPIYKPSHKKVTRKNGGRKLMKPKEILWCGEGDLNPHEIAPASTSRYLTRFRPVSRSCVLCRERGNQYPRVSPVFPNTVAKPLAVRPAIPQCCAASARISGVGRIRRMPAASASL